MTMKSVTPVRRALPEFQDEQRTGTVLIFTQIKGGGIDGLWKKVRYESDRQEKNSKEKVVVFGGQISPPIFCAEHDRQFPLLH